MKNKSIQPLKMIFVFIILLLFVCGCGGNRFKKYQKKDDTDYTVSRKPAQDDTKDSGSTSDSTETVYNRNYQPNYTNKLSSFEVSMAMREAQENVEKAYKIGDFNEGIQFLKNNNPEKASEFLNKAYSKSASNGFIKAKIQHADLMVNRKKALNNRALTEALKICDDSSRRREAISLANEAIKSDPKNLVVKKQANKIIYDLSKKSSRSQALEAKYKMIDAKKLIQKIIKKSSSYTVEYKRK